MKSKATNRALIKAEEINNFFVGEAMRYADDRNEVIDMRRDFDDNRFFWKNIVQGDLQCIL